MTLVKFNERRDNGGLLSPVFNDIFENLFNDSFISDRMISRYRPLTYRRRTGTTISSLRRQV